MADAALAEAAALEKQVRDFASTGGTTVENPNDLESAELLPPDEYEVRQFFWDPSSHRICVVHKETGAWGLVAAEGGDTFENSGPSGAACEVG